MEKGGESTELARAYAQLGWFAAHGWGEKSTAVSLLERGFDLSMRLGDTVGGVRTGGSLGHVLVYHTGDVQRGLEMYQTARQGAERSGDWAVLSRAAVDLSRECAFLRDTENALLWAQQANEASRQAGTLRGQIDSALALSWARVLQGDVNEAVAALNRAQQVADKADIDLATAARGGLHVVPARVRIFLGDWEHAEHELLHLMELSEQSQSRALRLFWVVPTLEWLNLERGDSNQAMIHLREAAAFAEQGGDIPPELSARAILVQAACKVGDQDEAGSNIQRVREIVSWNSDWLGLTAEVHLAEGMLAVVKQRWGEAEEAFRQAVEVNRRYHLPFSKLNVLWSGARCAWPGMAQTMEAGQRNC